MTAIRRCCLRCAVPGLEPQFRRQRVPDFSSRRKKVSQAPHHVETVFERFPAKRGLRAPNWPALRPSYRPQSGTDDGRGRNRIEITICGRGGHAPIRTCRSIRCCRGPHSHRGAKHRRAQRWPRPVSAVPVQAAILRFSVTPGVKRPDGTVRTFQHSVQVLIEHRLKTWSSHRQTFGRRGTLKYTGLPGHDQPCTTKYDTPCSGRRTVGPSMSCGKMRPSMALRIFHSSASQAWLLFAPGSGNGQGNCSCITLDMISTTR